MQTLQSEQRQAGGSHLGDRLWPDEFAQARHLHRQVGFLNHEPGPDHVEQLTLADESIAALDECQQQVEGAGTERDRPPVVEQLAFDGQELKTAETEAVGQGHLT